jgi:hypothetical protein
MAADRNIYRTPYCVAPRKVVEKLISAGYLSIRRKHDVKAVEEALNRLRQASKEFLKRS